MAMKNETGRFSVYDSTSATQTPTTANKMASPIICQTVRPQRIAELAGRIIKMKINNDPTTWAETATVVAIKAKNATSIKRIFFKLNSAVL